MSTENKKTILVVDDMEVNRKILSVILEDKYQVIEADNGKTAQIALEQSETKISLILLDLIMPEMDGFTFLKYMQSVEAYRNIPVILVTSETYEENILNSVKIGARDVIAKPYTPELVLRRTENLIALTEDEDTDVPVSTRHEEEQNNHNPRAILVVDDVGINRAIIRNAIEKDYEVFEASDGEEALDLLRAHHYEIAAILLDIIMPVMDGYEMMRIANQEKLLNNIPVIAITAETSAQKLNKIMEMGICEVIQKPFAPQVVQNRVEYIVELSRRKPISVANITVTKSSKEQK